MREAVPWAENVGGKVLLAVVDDDAAVRDSLRFLLEIEGFDVETYASGLQLLAAAELERFACLLLDQQMPGLTGLELLARLRCLGVTTPALLISAIPSATVIQRASELGAYGVLTKPLAQDELLAQIAAATGS